MLLFMGGGSCATALAVAGLLLFAGACSEGRPDGTVVTFPGSALGAEAEVLRVQLARFIERHPGIRVAQQRTPDAADARHQVYVQWLNARAPDPDILQLDVVWTPELAAAGWLLPLDRYAADLEGFFSTAVAANRYGGALYAIPWFIDVGLLYYRSDVLPHPPRSQAELVAQARDARRHGLEHGLVWQGARYEGIVAVFTEYLAAYGGEILDSSGRAALDTIQARHALEAMRSALRHEKIVPMAALGWQEEQTRFAFQNGRALFMRNWPYAYALMQGPDSAVRDRFGVAVMPKAPGGRSAATLGGSQLAINAYSDAPDAAWAVVQFLVEPEQALERARVAGQLPPLRGLYQDPALAAVLPIAPERAREAIDRAVARPRTPVYAELSDILQIHVHRCLSGQEETGVALGEAHREVNALLARVGLAPPAMTVPDSAGDG